MMIIIGAGIAGLIAANYFRKHNPTIIEIQSTLPNNHGALLRFKTDIISKTLNIPFRKVEVKKALVHGSNFLDVANPYACNQYSLKVTGKILSRSVWDLSPVYRYIAPFDFIERLSQDIEIEYSKNFVMDGVNITPSEGTPFSTVTDVVISTIPMPIMVKKSNWKGYTPYFDKKPIWSFNCILSGIDIDIYQTIYFSDIEKPYYRASITGNKFIVEFIIDIQENEGFLDVNEIGDEILDYFGIPKGMLRYENATYKKQEYGKIVPIDEDFRQEFIYTMTREHNIYSLGRFATWRQLQLDDLIHDLKVIESLINVEDKRKLYHQDIVAAHKKISLK